MAWLEEIRFDDRGLVPVIAQEAGSGDVLMLAWANRDALERTAESGRAHYWSRSRQALWMKGETSGHIQSLVEIRVDCDGDAVLYRVNQTGPACHTGAADCFFRAVDGDELVESPAAAHVLARIDDTVVSRIREPKAGSYTNYLLDSGLDKVLKKVGEETTEVVIAAKNGSADELRSETADLLFHLIVLLRVRDLPLDAIWEELEERFGRPPRRRSELRERGIRP
jgi:phosphoribosyl-ATP pyrophosphohydrolase/phosphoribosyl-AMP cyclohydrolase